MNSHLLNLNNQLKSFHPDLRRLFCLQIMNSNLPSQKYLVGSTQITGLRIFIYFLSTFLNKISYSFTLNLKNFD